MTTDGQMIGGIENEIGIGAIDNRISNNQVRDILSIQPIYANRYYFSVEDGIIRLTFADEASNGPNNSLIKMRSSIAMSINGFMALMAMLQPQADKIKKMFEDTDKQKG